MAEGSQPDAEYLVGHEDMEVDNDPPLSSIPDQPGENSVQGASCDSNGTEAECGRDPDNEGAGHSPEEQENTMHTDSTEHTQEEGSDGGNTDSETGQTGSLTGGCAGDDKSVGGNTDTETGQAGVVDSGSSVDNPQLKNLLDEFDNNDRNAETNWKQAKGSSAEVTGTPKKPESRSRRPPWTSSNWSSRDTEQYRQGYPRKNDRLDRKDNYLFYTNKIRCKPDRMLIDEIHEKWFADYFRLEVNHGYIQWLFPIRERGLNWDAQELQSHEIESICADKAARGRLIKSYHMMLDFYGMNLKSVETGELERAAHWSERFNHLNGSMHNYLRITRILKCLGEFKYEHLKYPFIRFVLHEAIVERTLFRVVDSCMNYWVEVLRDDKEREEATKLATDLIDKHPLRSRGYFY